MVVIVVISLVLTIVFGSELLVPIVVVVVLVAMLVGFEVIESVVTVSKVLVLEITAADLGTGFGG